MTGGAWSYTWEHGRQLAAMSKSGTTWSFTYDADGMRTKRTNGSTTYSYVYNGSQLSYMGVGSDHFYFSYDASGTPVSVKYNNTTYYYTTNLQGDVTAILNSSGAAVVTYTYDAWGNVTATANSTYATLAERNPLKYRGYVYDSETGLYYLQSRYYNPGVGRFLSADAFVSTDQGMLGNNMFAYCLNNPVCRKDIPGTTSVEIYDSNGNNVPDDQEYGGNGNGGNNGNSSNGGTQIYRYGYNGPEKLVPSQNDVRSDTGLSFSTRYRPGSAVTTIEEINSTGTLHAVQDSPTHVSVYPLGGTIGQWYDAGVGSIWTQALVSVVVKN